MNDSRGSCVWAAVCFLILSWGINARGGGEPGWPPAFFAFDNRTGRGELSAEEQADFLAEFGYAGLGYTGTQAIPEMLAALDARGLKMFSIYVGGTVGPEGAEVAPGLSSAIKQLAGRPTAIWLYLQGDSSTAPTHDASTAELVRRVADEAATAGLEVVLYPHVGFYVERVEDAVRLARLIDRPNVGVSLNLCHFLRLQDANELDRVLEEARPYLRLVSINGADPIKGGAWERLIQPLDQGQYDVAHLLRLLRSARYDGPVGLQCYALKEPIREHLLRSMTAWKRIASEVP